MEREPQMQRQEMQREAAQASLDKSSSASSSTIGKAVLGVAVAAALVFGGMQIFGGSGDGMTFTSPAVAVLTGQMQETPAQDIPTVLNNMQLSAPARELLLADVEAGKVSLQHYFLQIPGGGSGTTSLGSFTTTKTVSGMEKVRVDVPVPVSGGIMTIRTNGQSTAYFRNGSTPFVGNATIPVGR